MTAVLERPGWLAPLVRALADPARLDGVVALRPGQGARQAGVLILLGEGGSGPEVLLVERASTMRTHAGQIAFPGGSADPGDADLAHTALREAWEETGVRAEDVDVLGALPPAHVAVSGFDVTGVLGWWVRPAPVRAVDAAEVASVLRVPLRTLADPALRARVAHPSGYTGPAFEVGPHLVWGLTAHLLDGVLELGGWARPWDRTRVLPIPARYLQDRRPSDHQGRPAGPPDLGGPDAH